MSKDLHLVNRNGVFYWRRRLPSAFVPVFGRTEIIVSLRCREPRAARRIAGFLSVRFDHFLYRMQLEQRLPSPVEQKEILQELYRFIVENCHDAAASTFNVAEMPDWIERVAASSYLLEEDPPSRKQDWWDSFFRHQRQSAEILREQLKANLYGLVRELLEPFLEARQIDVAQNDVAFRKFLRAAGLISAQAFEDGAAETNGDLMPTGLSQLVAKMRSGADLAAPPPGTDYKPDQAAAIPAKPTEPLLSSFVESFLAERLHETDLVNSTGAQKEIAVSLLLRIIGDKPLSEIGRTDAKNLRRTLERLPSTLGKSSRHKTMPIREIIDQSPPGYRTMSMGTLDRHWQNILEFVKWVNRQDGVGRIDIDHIFGDLKWGKDVPQAQKRIRWDSDSLRRLFSSPIWMGFKPHPEKRHWRHEPGDTVVKDEYWWLPLLSAYHGARLEELSELKGSDIQEIDGIVAMRLRGEHLKTDSSERDVPLHSAIIKLGFVDVARKAGSGYVFRKMLRGGRDNKLGYDFSGDFTEYRKEIEVYRKWMDFHSFRHNVTKQILNAKLDQSDLEKLLIADEITGHDSKLRQELRSETLTYFDGFHMRTLKAAIETVQYPEIDIDRLLELSKSAEEAEHRLAVRLPDIWGDNPKPRERVKKQILVPGKSKVPKAAQ